MLEKLKVEVTAEMRQKSEEYFIIRIHESLSKKKYLVVFDDVWSIDFWTKLKVALPEDNNGSRVLITTRHLAVAEKAETMKKPYKLRFLNEFESKKLLLKKVFPNWNVAECPDNLLPLATQFAKKCKGLPLALEVLGGFLSTKSPDYDTWNEIISKMNWNTEGAECMDVVSTSYDDLPVHLKPCFMYFASFPEDCEIRVSSLTRLWIAEGFIQPEPPKSLEDTAMNYIEELIQRCMVQVSNEEPTIDDNKIEKCRIHDILHALAIRKAEEDNFLMVCTKSRAGSNSSIHTSTPIPIRRVAFQEFGHDAPKPAELLGPNLRSLMCYGTSLPDCNKLEMVRVLILRYSSSGIGINDAKWKWLKQVTNLRYLHVENISGRPEHADLSYLAQLKYLQTLELSGVKHRARSRGATFVPCDMRSQTQESNSKFVLICSSCVNENNVNKNKKDEYREEEEEFILLPDSFWDNKMLRHVVFPPVELWMGPPSSAKLENLLTLEGVHVRAEWISVKLPHFPRIRDLSIVVDADFNWEAMTNSLVHQEHLTSLHVSLLPKHTIITGDINYVTPALRYYKQLHSLTLPLFREIDFDPESESFYEPIISHSYMLPPNLVHLHYVTFRRFPADDVLIPTPPACQKLRKNLPHLRILSIEAPGWAVHIYVCNLS